MCSCGMKFQGIKIYEIFNSEYLFHSFHPVIFPIPNYCRNGYGKNPIWTRDWGIKS